MKKYVRPAMEITSYEAEKIMLKSGIVQNQAQVKSYTVGSQVNFE